MLLQMHLKYSSTSKYPPVVQKTYPDNDEQNCNVYLCFENIIAKNKYRPRHLL